jgi:hypothetical protein
MVLLQKRMVSSIAAIRKSLERRLIALEHPEAAALTPADHLEQVMEQRRRMYDQIESRLFMPLRHFDKGEADRVITRSHALTPSNADIEAFVRRCCDAHGGKIDNTRQKGVVRIHTPRALWMARPCWTSMRGRLSTKRPPSATSQRMWSLSRLAIHCWK